MSEEQNLELQEAEETDELNSALESLSKGSKDESTPTSEDSQDRENKEEGEKGEEEGTGETEGSEKKVGEKEEGKGKNEEPDHIQVLQEEVKDLRQMVRTSKRELTQTQAKLERVSEGAKTRREARDEDEDEDEDDDEGKGERKVKKETLSTVEELQGAIANVGTLKGAALDVLLEAMEQNSKYEDIREVCSRGNFDDIFEVIAAEATKSGGNFDETLLEVELNVWNKSNPYRYMYELIKKYHPSYAKKEGVAAPGGKEKKGGKTPEKVKAPGTIADKGGDSNLKGGWTAKRIDDLPEDELHIVPKEIYNKYMRDDLD